MLLKNIDSSTGLVNGRRGIITDVLQDETTGKIHGISVNFDAISTFDEQEELIHMIKVDSFRRTNGKILNFYQFPLKLCYSVTAHKSQGQTLSKVAICLDEKAFAHGSFYVALSRVRSIDDIIFFGTKFPEKGPDLHTNMFISDFQFKLSHQL
jgi:ATP-dependent exoDNAse (exonuclease V) alpha subunit